MYRLEQFGSEAKQFVFIARFVLVVATLFIVSDLTILNGRTELSGVFAARFLWAASSIGLLVAVPNLRDPNRLYLFATAYAVVSISVVLLVDLSRPAGYISHYALDMLFLFAIYLIYPIPLSQKMFASFMFSLGAIILLLVYKEPAHAFTEGITILNIALANTFGFLSARGNGISRRLAFNHNNNQHTTSLRLEKAIQDAKELSLLLPICGKCKKVREDDGYWRKIESFLSEHSPAEFTHGMCPECAEKWDVPE